MKELFESHRKEYLYQRRYISDLNELNFVCKHYAKVFLACHKNGICVACKDDTGTFLLRGVNT